MSSLTWAVVLAALALAAPALLHFTRRRSPRAALDFNIADEAIHHLDSEDEPWSVHVEVRLRGRLDEERLRRAVLGAQRRHPMARAAQEKWRPWHVVYRWRIDEENVADPTTLVECATDEEVGRARAAFQGRRVPVDASPPFRLLVARHAEGDYVILNVNHAATDGVGALRFLRSIGEAYGAELPESVVDDLDMRDLSRRAASPSFRVWWARQVELNRMLRRAVLDPPTRIALDTADAVAGGVGILQRVCDVGLLSRRSNGVTANDVLLAAQHVAIDRWNRQMGSGSGRVSTMMPINLRPRDALFEVMSNLALFASVSTQPLERADLSSAVRAVAAQTRELKDKGTAAALREIMMASPALLIEVKRRLAPLLYFGDKRFVDTAVLSNLGLVRHPITFGELGNAAELWFTPPCRMPIGLGMGVSTYEGRLFVSFRYRRAMWTPAAAAHFADLFEEVLGQWAESDGVGSSSPRDRST